MLTSEALLNKQQLRSLIKNRRADQPDKEDISRRILRRLFALPAYQSAQTVLLYVDVRDEVRTRWALEEILQTGKRLAVPFCVGAELELFHLQDVSELEPGRFGILEPAPSLRNLPERRVLPAELDFLVIPGVAFDEKGRRLGHGQGFYDRLLSEVAPERPKVGLAFQCQIVPEVPSEPHDRAMDAVVTEAAIYSSGPS